MIIEATNIFRESAALERTEQTLNEQKKQITPDEASFIMEIFEVAELIHTKRELGNLKEILEQLPADKRKKILLNQKNLEQLKIVLVELGHELAGVSFKRNQAKEWFQDLEQYLEPSFESMIQG